MSNDVTMNQVDILNELASSEDEFDVDLMACGCRLVAEAHVVESVSDLVQMYGFSIDQVVELTEAIIAESGVSPKVVSELAARTFRGNAAVSSVTK